MAIRRAPLADTASGSTVSPLTAIYARVSSEDQADRGTIQGQFDYFLPYAASKDWTIVRQYCDEGVSGTRPLESRPQGSRLLADARAGGL